MNKVLRYLLVVGLLLACWSVGFAEDQFPKYLESVQLAIDHAANPVGWRPASLFVIPDTTAGTTEGLTYDNGALVVRTAQKSGNYSSNYVGQANYKIWKTSDPQRTATWVTTGNDATKFLMANNVTGANVTKLLERGLGMDASGAHDAIIEFAVKPGPGQTLNDLLMRPTRNPDITRYLPTEYYDTDTPVKPDGMDQAAFDNFTAYYNNWKADAYNLDPVKKSYFPWSQLGYTFFWGNGYSPANITGMSEFIMLGGTPVEIYGIYATQSYIYTLNKGGAFSSDADAQYGNGFASFKIDGSCDTVWAGHRFQKNASSIREAPNQIIITPDGSVAGGQGILVWSLNYAVTNNGVISGATGTKFGISGTQNIAVLFKGDTGTDYGTPVTDGFNLLLNYGTITSPGTAVKAEAGDTLILNAGRGIIAGDAYAVQTGAGEDRILVVGGKVAGGIAAIEMGDGKDEIRVGGGIVTGGSTGIATGDGKDKVKIYGGGIVTGGITGITTGDGKDKVVVKKGVVTGGEYAIRTGKDDDKIVFKGGEIAGRIDMGAGTDTLTVKGHRDPRFIFTLDRNNAAAGQIVNAEEVSIAEGSSATLAVKVGGAANIRNNDRFLIVEAGTLNVDPAQITVLNDGARPMLTFSLEKTENRLSLVAARERGYYGRRGGNASLGAVLDSLAETGSEDMSGILGALDASGDPGSARQLEPNGGGGTLQAGFGTAGLFNQAVISRIDQVRAGRFAASGMTGISTGEGPDREGIWGQGFGAVFRQDTQGQNIGYRASVWGGSFGYDRFVFDHLMAGFGGGYARNRITSLDDAGQTYVDSYQANLYGSLARDAYHIDALLSFAYNFYDTSRHIAFGGIDRTARGDYTGQQYSLMLEGGYAIQNGGFVITPLASMQAMRLHINGYAETGAGALDLSVGAQDYNLFETGLGAKLAYPVQSPDLRITPEIHAKWLYDFAGDRQQSTSRFSGGGASFSSQGIEPLQSTLNVGAKLTVMTKSGITVSLNYDYERKADFYGHTGSLNVRYAF